MLNIYKTTNNTLEEVESAVIESGSWLKLTKPNSEELNRVSEMAGVPSDFLSSALDENEHSRVEIEEDYLLVIINIPIVVDKNSFDTMPLGIIITTDYFITVSLKENKVVDSFLKTFQRNFSTEKKTHFLFLILLRSAELYLRYMRYINNLTDEIELSLRKSLKNKALFQLFELERSLVYFITALKDNNSVTQKLLRILKNKNFTLLSLTEDDEELLEDVMIENKQAIEMVEMHSNILGGMMDAFASIISNNLNIVMKYLTSVTILLAIPTMVASFWGMNVDVPFKDHTGGFAFVVAVSVISACIAAVALWKNKMF